MYRNQERLYMAWLASLIAFGTMGFWLLSIVAIVVIIYRNIAQFLQSIADKLFSDVKKDMEIVGS